MGYVERMEAILADVTEVDAPALLPTPRGPISEALFTALVRPPHELPAPGAVRMRSWEDDDVQLALYCCYELAYRGFAGVDDRWEWSPSLLRWRAALEAPFEAELRRLAGPAGPPAGTEPGTGVPDGLHALVGASSGPSLSAYVEAHADVEQVRELAVHRSAYQLKEADPHTWVIPRLAGRAKAAVVEIQYEEYGSGVAADTHAALFARTMAALGLDPAYGAYLDVIPAATLGTVNLISFLGLHRRLRGALVGHLAVFEMTSVVPMARYSRALTRLGFGADACRFYDVHVEADARHEVIAVDAMAGGLAEAEPALAGDILFGARAAMAVEERFAGHVLDCWGRGRSSLRT